MLKWFRKRRKQETKTEDISLFLTRYATYEKVNSERLSTLHNKLVAKRLDIFRLIPLVLHEESIGLPGNEGETRPPSGLFGFDPSREELQLLYKYFPETVIEKKAKGRRHISFLCVMGSAGTASFTSESDIDFWVGIDSSRTNEDSIFHLKAKLSAIERWCMETAKLQVHFFITEPEALKREDYGAVGGESCGTALGKLLKDEFYRTALFICGRRPWYWVIRDGASDSEYLETIKKLSSIDDFPHADFIDLGNIHSLSKDEFIGAALWHLGKTLESPFKSLLKIGYIDNIATLNETLPLCEKYKQLIFYQQGEKSDPYTIFADFVREGYIKRGLRREKALMETAYYIKSLGAPISSFDEKKQLVETIATLTHSWGVQLNEIERFCNHREWDYASVESLRKRIIQYLIGTYGRIRKLAEKEKNRISERDALLLGRRFRSFFEQKENKISYEFLLHSLSDIASLQLIEQRGEWHIKLRIRNTSAKESSPLKSFKKPLDAAAYIILNRLPCTQDLLSLHGHIRFSKTAFIDLLKEAGDFFGKMSVDSVPPEGYLLPVSWLRLFVIPNWDEPDWNRGIASLAVFLWSGHAELFTYHYKGADWKRWLYGEILQNKIGIGKLNSIKAAVYKPNNKNAQRFALSENIEKELVLFISSARVGASHTQAQF